MFEFDCINCDTEEVGVMSSQPLVDGHSLADFRGWIRRSDAVVLEGIYSGRAPPPSSPFETPASAVARIAPAATRFQLMQLGICLLNESDGVTYIARPFTIDVFPAVMSYRRDLLSKTLFDCDAAHMKTLSDQNFDFNRVFNSGMNWFSPKDETYLLEKMRRKRASEEASINDKRSNIKITDPKDKVFIDIVDAILTKFSATDGDVAKTFECGHALLEKIPVSDHLISMSVSKEGRLVLTPGNGFLRRLLHQMIGERQELVSQRVASSDIRRPALAVLMSSTRDADRSLVPSEVLRRKILRELDDAENAAVVAMHEQIGFRYILEELLKAGKPILADDLLELLLHFEFILMGELGQSYLQVKDSFVNHWTASSLYDTTLDSKKNSKVIVAKGFEKFSQVFDTLEAGAIALKRSSEIDIDRIRQPFCRIAIPHTISEIYLEEDFDTFIVDVTRIIVIQTGKSQAIVEDLLNARLVEILYQDNNRVIAEAKQNTQRLISDINSKLGGKLAISFQELIQIDEKMKLSFHHQNVKT